MKVIWKGSQPTIHAVTGLLFEPGKPVEVEPEHGRALIAGGGGLFVEADAAPIEGPSVRRPKTSTEGKE